MLFKLMKNFIEVDMYEHCYFFVSLIEFKNFENVF